MAKKCIYCGLDIDDSSVRCGCGGSPQEAAVIVPAAATMTEPGSSAPSQTAGRNLGLRKIVFVLWFLAFVPLFAVLRSRLHLPPLYRSLLGTGVFCLPAVGALWFLGREGHRTLRAWRIFFLLWGLLLTPLLLTIVYGIAEQGWPSGRPNRPVAEVLRLILILTIPALLTGLCAVIRSYRVAGALAFGTGLTYLVAGVLLIRATSPIRIWPIRLVDVLDIVAFGAKVTSYLSVPVGVAFLVGGIMTFRAAGSRVLR